MSPRPRKPRNCACPLRARYGEVYKPAGIPLKEIEITVLEHDELEAMHLCDALGLSQEEAGREMGVSRGTVQRALASGRKKAAEALVGGKALAIGTSATPEIKGGSDQ